MRLLKWNCMALILLSTGTVAKVNSVCAGWIFFDPNNVSRVTPGDPPTTLTTVATTKMILSSTLRATVNSQGVFNDLYKGTIIDPGTLPGFNPVTKSVFDPNTGLPFDPNLGLIIEPDMGVFLDVTIPGMFVNTVTAYPYAAWPLGRDVKYQRLSCPPYYGILSEVGSPELPVLGRTVEVPAGVKVILEVTSTTSAFKDSLNIYPVQPARERQIDPNEAEFVVDWKRYSKNEDYPANVARIAYDGLLGPNRYIMVQVHPVQYNPVTHRATLHSNIQLALVYESPDPNESADRQGSRGDIQALDDGKEVGCDYLIITADQFYVQDEPDNGIVRLVDWKRRKGYQTRVVTVSEILDWSQADSITADDIREFLLHAYQHWDPAPQYVLLVGDVRNDEGEMLLPTHHSSRYRINVATDLYYATLNGDDFWPDIYVGRLSVDTLAEANRVIERVIHYEMNPPTVFRYYTDVTLVQLFEDTDGNGREDDSFRIIESAEVIREYLDAYPDDEYRPRLIYNQSGDLNPGPQQYQDGSRLPEQLRYPAFLWDGGVSNILDVFREGHFLLAYNGHGGKTTWGLPPFSTDDVEELINDINTPVVLSLACKTGWFDNEVNSVSLSNTRECLCERLLRRSGGGAAAVIGSSRSSYADNDYLILGMFGAIWPGLVPVVEAQLPCAPATGPWNRMGQINLYGKLWMQECEPDSSLAPLHFELYNLFGDPEMLLWTGEPRDLVLDRPREADGGDIRIHVADSNGSPIPGAVVVLTCADAGEPMRMETDAEGFVSLPADKVGRCDLTVTAPNCRPHMEKF